LKNGNPKRRNTMRERISNNILKTFGKKEESKGSFIGDKVSNNEGKSAEDEINS
jgi:hypothetical protein